MEESASRRKFDSEFKKEAVRLVIEGGRPAAEVARGLGIHENLLHGWKKKYILDPEHPFPGKGHLKPHEEEFRKLQRENANLKEEREILKKALAIFSRTRIGDTNL